MGNRSLTTQGALLIAVLALALVIVVFGSSVVQVLGIVIVIAVGIFFAESVASGSQGRFVTIRDDEPASSDSASSEPTPSEPAAPDDRDGPDPPS
jgi:hypothetical protein